MLSRTTARPSVPNDDALLEADVMRFMAILGFCLMVIFALIEAIPVSQTDNGIELKNTDTVAAQFTEIVQRLQRAKGLAVRLQKEVTRNTEVLQLQRNERQALEDDLAAKNTALDQLREALQQMSSAVDQTREQLSEIDTQLRRAQASLIARTRSLRSIDTSIERAKRQVQHQEQKLSSLETELTERQAERTAPLVDAAVEAETVVTPEVPVETSSPTVPKTVEPRGFSLRFDSTQALRQLVRLGHTILYAEVGTQIWQARRAGGFELAPAPYKPYEITDPPGSEVVNDFRSSSGVLSTGDERWLVKFSAGVAANIRARMQQSDGGNLVILGDGSVLTDR